MVLAHSKMTNRVHYSRGSRINSLQRLQFTEGTPRVGGGKLFSTLTKREKRRCAVGHRSRSERELRRSREGSKSCGNPAASWVKQRRHPRAPSKPNRLNVPSNTLLHLPPNHLRHNAPSTITPSLPALPRRRHRTRQILLILTLRVPQNVPLNMERVES